MAIGAIVQVLAYWIAAKVVVGDPKWEFRQRTTSFGSFTSAWSLRLSCFLGVGLPMLIEDKILDGRAVVFAGTALLALALFFLLPMKIFGIGFLSCARFSPDPHRGVDYGMHKWGLPVLWANPHWAASAVLVSYSAPSKSVTNSSMSLVPARNPPLWRPTWNVSPSLRNAKPFPQRHENLRKVYETLEAQQRRFPSRRCQGLAEYEFCGQNTRNSSACSRPTTPPSKPPAP
jgi:hypothetical protein